MTSRRIFLGGLAGLFTKAGAKPTDVRRGLSLVGSRMLGANVSRVNLMAEVRLPDEFRDEIGRATSAVKSIRDIRRGLRAESKRPNRRLRTRLQVTANVMALYSISDSAKTRMHIERGLL